jgi:hypothetical protein
MTLRRISARPAVSAALCALSLALAACGGGSSPSASSVVVGEGSDRFPSETLVDWASYADQLSVVTVVDESEITPPSEVVELGEGYIGRTVTLRIEQTVWSRKGGPTARGTIRTTVQGWVLQDGVRRPFAVAGGPRLEVGGRYLAPLLRVTGNDWITLSTGATLPLDGDVATTAGVAGHPSPVGEAMRGKSIADVAELLATTPADPIAAKYAQLEPDERLKAVQREKGYTG